MKIIKIKVYLKNTNKQDAFKNGFAKTFNISFIFRGYSMKYRGKELIQMIKKINI